MLGNFRAVGCWRRSGLTHPWRKGGGPLRNPLRWSTSVQLWVLSSKTCENLEDAFIYIFQQVRNMREERINSGRAFKSELFKGAPFYLMLIALVDNWLLIFWCKKSQSLVRCGDGVCFWRVPSTQRWASTTNSQWRYTCVYVVHLNLFQSSNKGGSVANTARVASVVVGEFRDPGENQ